jgi:hypothetical protein
MRIRIRIQQLKLMRIHADPDPDPDPKPWFLGLEILKFFDADPDPGFGIVLTLDSVRKDSDPG